MMQFFHLICKSINHACVYIYTIHFFLNIWRNVICWNWVREFGILEGWIQILHREAETGAAALLFWIKPSSLSQRLQNRVSSAPLLVSIHATFIYSKSAPSSPLPTLSRLCNISVHTSLPPAPLLLVAFRSQCICLKRLFFCRFPY